MNIAAFPKGATIILCQLRDWLRGIKGNVLLRLEVARLAADLTDEYFERGRSRSTSATATTTTLNTTAAFSAMQKLKQNSPLHSLDGLANKLGITKEGALRLIWLCADALDTNSGSEKYSEETITLVKNALFVERILKQTTLNFYDLILTAGRYRRVLERFTQLTNIIGV